jgi:hypothetical protein
VAWIIGGVDRDAIAAFRRSRKVVE